MKFAFSTNAFKKHPLEDAVKKIGEVGYEGVEILCDVPHAYPPVFKKEDRRSLKRLISNYNLQISNLNAFTLYAIQDIYHPSWIEDKTTFAQLRIEHTINCIMLAKDVGAKNLSTEPGGPVDGRIDRKKLEKLFVSNLSKVTKVAEREGVNILVEPEPNMLIERSEQFLNFIKRIRSEVVRLNFDIGHFFCVKEDPAKIVHKLSDYIEHFHLADIAKNRVHDHLIPGKGAIDFRSVFKAIDEIGYNGFVTVELYPYQDDPIYAASNAL
ncbi:MAG TPA: sugar phosphate isomerase/epimerase, partial [Candidatus Nitrosopolaris sp.]